MTDLNKELTIAYELFTQKKFKPALEKIEAIKNLIQNNNSEQHLDNNKIDEKVGIENFRGFIYLGLKENAKARECFEKSLNLKPESSQACAGLGEVLYLEARDHEAKLMYEWSLVNDSKNIFAMEGLKKVNKLLLLDENDNSLTSALDNG